MGRVIQFPIDRARLGDAVTASSGAASSLWHPTMIGMAVWRETFEAYTKAWRDWTFSTEPSGQVVALDQRTVGRGR